MSSIDTLRWFCSSTEAGRCTWSTLAITVRMWLAPVALTVSGSAASEQTWSMMILRSVSLEGADLWQLYPRFVGWAKARLRRAHHLSLGTDGGHASLCPPYDSARPDQPSSS